MASQSEVTQNEAEHRYELAVEGQTAFAQYNLNGDIITFTHTIVPEEMEGQGIGSRLVSFALDDARSRDLKVVPMCSFVRGYIERHPEYQDLLDS
ncbi:MAG TPA: GNAT family N-acetyltransferase [Allosphingosinicella sp.]|nr:GNAT family N-acetyltransferase [Allosphingosinicella sp.]